MSIKLYGNIDCSSCFSGSEDALNGLTLRCLTCGSPWSFNGRIEELTQNHGKAFSNCPEPLQKTTLSPPFFMCDFPEMGTQ